MSNAPSLVTDIDTHLKYLVSTGDRMSFDEYLELRAMWRSLGGRFYGPHIETAAIPEEKILPVLRAVNNMLKKAL